MSLEDEFLIHLLEFTKKEYEYERKVPFFEIERNEFFISYANYIKRILEKCFHSDGVFHKDNMVYYVPFLLFRFIEEKEGWISLLEMNEFYDEYPEIKEKKMKDFNVCSLIRKLGFRRQLFLSQRNYILTIDYIHRHLIDFIKKEDGGKLKECDLYWFYQENPIIKPIIEKFGIRDIINYFSKNLSYYSKYCLVWKRGFIILSRRDNRNWNIIYDGIPEEFQINLGNFEKLSIRTIEESHKIILNSKPNSVSYQKGNKFNSSIDLKNLSEFFKFFKSLLFVEEMKLNVEISKYDMESAKLFLIYDSGYYLYKLDVPGLSERRPSILIGDTVLLKHNFPNHMESGKVWSINLDNIYISLPEYMEEKYYICDVHFKLNRKMFRMMQNALEKWADDPSLHKLFSSAPNNAISNNLKNDSSKYKVLSMELNSMQSKFINAVVSSCKTPFQFPLIIIGPPGTGKTTTIVESIIQVLKHKSKAKILVCTPSNSAGDQICERLINAFAKRVTNDHFKDFDMTKIMRINAAMRNPKTISSRINEECYVKRKDGVYVIPSDEEIKSVDIVVCTTITAGRLISSGLNIFSHIFCDEAGESLVGETLIPLSLKKKDTTIILAGDPKQLGPFIFSPLTLEYGMEISIFERLFNIRKMHLKKKHPTIDEFLSVGIFHLYENYRAHKSILEIYNEIFYDGVLKAKGDQTLIKFAGLKNPKIPVLFKHVDGFERNDKDSPSWYNLNEIDEIIKTLSQLKETNALNEKTVGIISPYRKHCEKITKALEHQTFPKEKIRVGSIESFQGDECDIIIISFVRSQKLYLAEDLKFNIGFINNPKRINVAISRAKSLLIMIGNAKLLYSDPGIFPILLQKIETMGCYEGPSYKNFQA